MHALVTGLQFNFVMEPLNDLRKCFAYDNSFSPLCKHIYIYICIMYMRSKCCFIQRYN